MKKDKLTSLVLSAQRGDQNALSELFNTFYNDVYYFALKILKDEELACDITQETFIEIINTIGSLKEPAAFVTWMKQITYHQCTRHFKKKKDVLVEEDEDGHSVFDALAEERAEFIPDEALDQEDFRKTVLGIIDTLSEEQRAAIMLYYYDELTTKSIAGILGISEGTVKSRLIYARKAIKRSVEDYEKKNGVRLHSVAVFPLMAWLLAGAKETLSAAALPSVVGGINSATSSAIVLGSASTATAASAAAAGTGFWATVTSIPVIAKILTGVAVLAAVVGVVEGTISNFRPKDTPTDPTAVLQTVVTTPTDASTDPAVTEPTPTEPTPTEPIPADPEPTDPTEPETPEDPEDPPEDTALPVSQAGGTVEEGCRYVMADGTELLPGQAMPLAVSDGDEYITPDYTYKHGYELNEEYFEWVFADIDGWGVSVNDREKSAYGALLPQINGATLKSMAATFMNCLNLIDSPAIPAGVTSLRATFDGCNALKTAAVIPEGVTNMNFTFSLCFALEKAPVIPQSVTEMRDAFSLCYVLQTAPVLPENVVDIQGIFTRCYALQSAPVIPASVVYMEYAFQDCEALSGSIEIHASNAYITACFKGTTGDILLFGTSSQLDKLAATSSAGNVTVAQTSGIWEEGFAWEYDWQTKTLRISGEGEIPWETTGLPSSVQHLAPYIQALDIGSGITSMYLSTFHACEKLETVYVPDTFTFFDCVEYIAEIPSLKRFVVDENNTTFCSDDNGILYSKDMTSVERVPCGFAGDYHVPDSVTRLRPGYSLVGCNGLTNIYIGAGVTDLDFVNNWDYFACKKLQGIWVDEANPDYCSDENGALYSKDMTILYRVPMGYQGEFVIPAGVTTIENCAFDGCSMLTGVQIPEGVTSILEYAFYNCDGLIQLTLPSTLEGIYGWSTLSNCDNLEIIYFLGSAGDSSQTAFGLPALSNYKGVVYYPEADETWTEDVFNYFSKITWIAY